MAGSMDEVRIYNRALAQGEIQSDMQNAARAFVSPPHVTLYQSQTQQFTAAVTKGGGTGVTWSWSLSPNLGTIDASGLYTAPADIAWQRTVTVTATSQADATKTATARITSIRPLLRCRSALLRRPSTHHRR